LLRSQNGATEALGSVTRSARKFVVVGQFATLGSPLLSRHTNGAVCE